MDKNTITGFVLIALILFGFAWWQQPSEEQLEQQRKEFVEDSLRAVKAKQQQFFHTILSPFSTAWTRRSPS